MASEN